MNLDVLGQRRNSPPRCRPLIFVLPRPLRRVLLPVTRRSSTKTIREALAVVRELREADGMSFIEGGRESSDALSEPYPPSPS